MFAEFNYGRLYYAVTGKTHLLRLTYGSSYFAVTYNTTMIDVHESLQFMNLVNTHKISILSTSLYSFCLDAQEEIARFDWFLS